jgi:hypothetical protein
MISWESSDFTVLFFVVTASYATMIILGDYFEIKAKSHAFVSAAGNKYVKYGILSSLALVSVIYMFQAETSPFIYLQF